MKKIILALSGIVMVATMTMGCTRNITNTEAQLINRANSMIEEKYEVKIEQEDYTYDLSEVVDDNNFVDIKEGETPKIVFLRGVNKDKPSSEIVYDFSIKFNTETDEIISSEYGIY